MWMTAYINAIKRGFRDIHGFKPTGGTEQEPLFNNIPDGEYPMEIEGKTDYVRIVNGTINCCNFKEEKSEREQMDSDAR
jgi:hypothetical protein